MTQARAQRLRDPVHGLVVFEGNGVDQLAWQLLNTPEFQRLRRIKQLGVSEFVFPSATHTRFAHCVGVYHTARELLRIIERELPSKEQTYEPRYDPYTQPYDKERAEVAVVAALLHDLGHGPFSHTFEEVQNSRGVKKRHEKWTEEIIRNPAGGIRPLLDRHRPGVGFCDQVADLLGSEDPSDIYHAVVSSSFDADRLDYLQRDRLMTGTGAGAIDFDWLMDHIRVREIDIEAAEVDDDEHRAKVPTFCLDPKALPAAEQFLLARYTLHEQVYFHKTTRCIQKMIEKLLRRVATLAEDCETAHGTGLERDHPLRRFFSTDGQNLENYLALDDFVVMGAIERMCMASDPMIKDLARRLRERRLYKSLDLGAFGYDEGRQRAAARRIDRDFTKELKNETVIKDDGAAVSIYTQIGGDDERAHKRLHILDKAKGPVEITSVSKVIEALHEPKKFTRYYFESEVDRDRARHKRREMA
jgi:HD superfamily phosphohydrolase